MRFNNNHKKGLGCGVISALSWGADTVLMGFILSLTPFVKTGQAILLAPVITAFLHDSFSAIWTFIYLGLRKKLGQFFKAVKTKSALWVAIAALLGGPVGMSGYLLSVKYIGPSYTAIISSLYPAIGAILATIILKERINKKAWIGLVVTIIGVSILGISILEYTSTTSAINPIGFIFALVCAFGWGSECVICAYGMKGDEVTSEFALQIRQFTSAVTYGLIVIPIVGGIGLSIEIFKDSVIFWIIGTALAATVSYLFYYTAIYKIGATRAMGMNITYVVWAIIFDTIFLGNKISTLTIASSILVILGVYFIAKEPDQEVQELEFVK
ncbi:DMT family transporter [Clostridium taeniosporum]|uniref:EamA/RhaT family transporter n=1 Tax=Clostridium taeniosporum TaxID=394958 RepID=A0A1D7XN40_9CLOT|nr:DMT family transporter [Clostridium taeniosporum]AOR24539.1 EamA/RhaT family transporter [Clostridium taeniosporum]